MGEKKFKHVMIDTETLGRTPGSVVRSVAAVEFDPQTGETGRQKVWKIDLTDSMRYGFKVEASTLKWWMMQSDEARREFVEGVETPLVDFFEEFMEFLADTDEERDFTLWCLQLDFDVAMLRSMYSWYNLNVYRCDEEVLPWNFRKVRDVRPYMDALDSAGLLPPKVADRHTPLADCLAQINCVHLVEKNNLVVR
ncbi:3'-5' exoribonuclease [Phocaeicola plebeius]|uniref:3'-5' exoribonuclease n=1 Tax=Phocaeicola plebeius TaxID=310297 RepID=A0A3E4Z6X2_9BACT|nr:3'-5' exonuclease [Phocaeicola plebeius]RGM90278.1 3'-5' exoribonuclease [Phocaeicola plebeius]